LSEKLAGSVSCDSNIFWVNAILEYTSLISSCGATQKTTSIKRSLNVDSKTLSFGKCLDIAKNHTACFFFKYTFLDFFSDFFSAYSYSYQ